MDIIRLSTAGSVDDGKSTLIGRLLYDTKSLSKDKIENIEQISKQRGLQEVDLSLITDGLTAEREQGITIDVAHIYFASQKRKYIIADTPGHVEYTRNMITGSSNSNVFIILIDARNGIIEQTKRHLFIASLMKIKNIAFVINKIDLVNYDEARYNEIITDLTILIEKFNLKDFQLAYFPISAKVGDNVVAKSLNTSWYKGQTLLEYLESVDISNHEKSLSRYNVQYVIRPHSDDFHDFRGYAGKVISGTFKKGDEIFVSSTGQKSKIKEILKYKESLSQVEKNDSVVIELEDDIDISRGDVLTLSSDKIEGLKSFQSTLCWLEKDELSLQKRYLLQYAAARIPVKISQVESQLNFNTLNFEENVERVGVNSINKVEIKTASPIFLDAFDENTANGYFILIDESSNSTVAVGFRK